MTGITRDDVRAAVGAGMMSEAQAASLIALSDTRRGVRDHLSGLDEPFELFRGFNEIFIVVGLAILWTGWIGLTGLSFAGARTGYVMAMVYALIAMGGIAILARYFTLTRRMVAPSIVLAIFFAISAAQFGMGLGWALDADTQVTFTLAGAVLTTAAAGYYAVFRVPFTMSIIALGTFFTVFALTTLTGGEEPNLRELFLLTGGGPFAFLTVLLGLVGLVVAMAFDMSDPHRITRRSASGFWLHIIAAPAIVNTVALTLLDIGTVTAQLALVAFILAMALFAVVIDRRSFLVSGVGYIVALSITVMEGQAFLVILLLGLVLIGLGAQWEKIRRAIMDVLPNFPGKDRLPPWSLIPAEEPAT